MIISIPNIVVRVIAGICTTLLLLSLFFMEPAFYLLLRIAVFVGTLIILTCTNQNLYKVLLFLFIAVLFNPIIPIYLYKKYLWFPFDIFGAIAFLFEIIEFKPSITKPPETNKEPNIFGRDRIHKN
jgi:hypothetical protein